MSRYNEEYYRGAPHVGWKKGYNEKWLGLPHTRLHQIIHKFFPGHPSMLILGCALGLQVKRALACGDYAVGIDWAPAMPKMKLAPNLVRGCAWRLPFREGSFDLGVNVNLMEHIGVEGDEDETLRLVDLVISEQGRVCRNHFFSIPCMTDFRQLGSFFVESGHVCFKTREWWMKRLGPLGRVKEYHPPNPYGWRFFIIREGSGG